MMNRKQKATFTGIRSGFLILTSGLVAAVFFYFSLSVVSGEFVPDPESPARIGTVTAAVLSVRARPGTSYEVVSRLRRGDEVAIVSGLDKEWYEITAPADAAAWSAAHFIDAEGRVTADRVHVRAGPGLVFSPFALLERDDIVALKGAPRGGWQQIRVPASATVWVHGRYIELLEEDGPVEIDVQENETIEAGPPAAELFSFGALWPEDEVQLQPGLPAVDDFDVEADEEIEHLIYPARPIAKTAEDDEIKLDPPPAVEPGGKVAEFVEESLATDEETDSAAGPRNVGRVVSLGRQESANVTHLLLEPDSEAPIGRAYLISSFVNLNHWHERTVRVYGDEEKIPGWSLPVIRVTGIQLWETVPGR